MTQQDRAADYVMGMLSAEERTKIERDAAADPALAAEIARLNEEFSPLLLDAPEVEPPADLFARIKAAIARDRTAIEIPGSRTVRAGEGKWELICPGIERKMLWHDRDKKRITFLIRAQPGSEFPAHAHDDDEEAYVLSGDLIFDDLVLSAGDYHLARPGVHHPVGRTKGGCMLLVTAAA
jgi:quercetin dioxygenase-like cupin family protein